MDNCYKELCKEMFGDNFQAIIATHTNTENYHNHIVVNAYSINGEFKYHDKKMSFEKFLKFKKDWHEDKYNISSFYQIFSEKKLNYILKSQYFL